jgi:hypothetical protein
MKKIRLLALLISFLFIWWTIFAWMGRLIRFLTRRKGRWAKKPFDISSPPDALIIFNSGGWGHTSLEKATDFRSIIFGIQEELNQWGYKSLIIPYNRTKESLIGKVADFREVLSFFRSQSKYLAEQIDDFLTDYPDKKVIMTGLSMGAFFVDEVMKRVRNKSSVLVIKVGVPFYSDRFSSKNVLEVNDERDALALGKTRVLISTFLRGARKWILAKIKREPLSFGKATNIPGHFYSWESVETKQQIITFLKDRLNHPKLQ